MKRLTRIERRHQRAQRSVYAEIIRDYQAEKKAIEQAAIATLDHQHANKILKGAA